MKGWQQVDQMTGSMGDTIKLIMIDDDGSEHLCMQGRINWKISNHGEIFCSPQTICIPILEEP